VLNSQPEFNHLFYGLDATYTKGHKSVLHSGHILLPPSVISLLCSRFMALVGISARFMYVLHNTSNGTVRSRPLPCRIVHRIAIIRLAK